MTLTKYQSPATLEARLNANLGRSARDANLRLSIQNPTLDAALKSLGRAQPNRANLLIQSRTGKQATQRSRSWFPFVPLIGAGGWPDDALAVPADAAGADLALADALQLLEAIDWSNPAYTVALGTALLASQIVAMIQRQVLIHRLKPRAEEPVQSDLFPETIVEPEVQPSAWDVDAATRQGKVRTENQDAIAKLSFADGTHVIIVCDGAGGVAGGKEASHAAARAIKGHLEAAFEEHGQVTPQDLKGAITAARSHAAERAFSGLTTALLVLLEGDQIHWATLGDGDPDTAAYLHNDNMSLAMARFHGGGEHD